MIRNCFGLMILCIGLLSCGNNHTSILTITEMKPLIWDMLNADNWYIQESVMDTAFKKKKENIVFYDKIFKQYDVTKEQFYKSYSYYELHPEKMRVLMDSVEAYGTREKMNLDRPLSINKKK